MLRSHTNLPDEMNVFLQQIDEGPNYRWGRAAQGGCGELYYYANRRQYTGHSRAIISGVAEGETLRKCISHIKELITPFGVVVMKEPFSAWNAKFGKISLKKAGKDENGSVYVHACMFAIYALFSCGERMLAEQLLKNVLPTHEYCADFEMQPPIFLPNFYFAKPSGEYGRSSANISTGSAAWYLKIYRDFYQNR